MPHLSLSLLGPFQITLDGHPVTGLKSNKVRALLAYLAMEADRPHRREVLAGLLWSDWSDREALSNLRYALSNLRRMIGDHQADPPFLLVTRDTLQFNPASTAYLDATAFTKLMEVDETHPSAIDRLTQAAALYQGSFLEGFSVSDCPAFEEWALFTRERLARQMSSVLHRLAATYEQRGDYEQAQSYAWRQIKLEPWDETAHQQLIRTLALIGRRSAALAQYEHCRRLLAEQLGVEPSAETTRLYERVRTDRLKASVPSPAHQPALTPNLPPFLETDPPPVEIPLFVARERELAQLDGFLELALTGQGRVLFVTGEAGSGKTALLQEFTRRAQDRYADLGVASGNCNAYTGFGDPYLPFREVLELLTGDVEARYTVGAITRAHARHLWYTLPVAVKTLVEVGPDLIDTFVPRATLLERAMTFTPWPDQPTWLSRLEELRDRGPTTGLGTSSSQQSDLFEQYTRVVQALAQEGPLLLVLDDLQWADLGSISLLFHLGRHLAGSPILIVAAYRPEEIALGRDGQRHPLETVVNEFQGAFGDITLKLDQTEGRDFVEALLYSEPNHLGSSFRDKLWQQTHGQPLFTIELLRGLQQRGDLVKNPDGRWVEGPALNWEMLPARVEAVIAERIGRLPGSLQAALRVASVEGELFTAEVVAQVQATDEREMLSCLSGELDRRHRLIRAQSILRMEGQILSRYRFRHILFQKYLYSGLDEVERVHLHEQIGTALERLYKAQRKSSTIVEIAPQLAWHFQEARITEKAIHYLHQAGEKAVQLYAYQEGLAHLTRGLAMLKKLPALPEHAEQELALQLSLGRAWIATGSAIPEVEKAYVRARKLGEQTGQISQLCQVLGELSVFHYVQAEHQKALEVAEETLGLAQQAQDPLLVALSHWYLGFILFGRGEYTTARTHLEQMIAFYDPQAHHQPFVSLRRAADGGLSALAYQACCLWCLGYPDQALRQSQEVLSLARELDHSFSLADVLCYAGCMFHEMRRDAAALKEAAEELIGLASEKGLQGWLTNGIYYRGAALVLLGEFQEGMAQIRAGMAARESVGVRCYLPGSLGTLAEAQTKAGQLEEGLTTLDQALVRVQESSERHWEAELYRLKGELLLAQADEVAAEASLLQAIAVARRQQARTLELRATVSLSRLLQEQGKPDEARQRLAKIYGWFSEGFETADLIEARTLLEKSG